jgi:hypothetical protein
MVDVGVVVVERLILRSPCVRSHFNLAPVAKGGGPRPTSEERRLDCIGECSTAVEGETGGKLERAGLEG